MGWFSEWFASEVKKSGLSHNRLAKLLGCHQTYINRWIAGSNPSQEHMRKIIETFGGDIYRALPSYQPKKIIDEKTQLTAISFRGYIKKEKICPEKNPYSFYDIIDSFINTESWKLTRGEYIAYSMDESSGPLQRGTLLYARSPKTQDIDFSKPLLCIVSLSSNHLVLRKIQTVKEYHEKEEFYQSFLLESCYNGGKPQYEIFKLKPLISAIVIGVKTPC